LNKFNRYNRSSSRKKGSSFGGSKALKKTPISVAEEYSVMIEDVSRKGNAGVAKIGGFVIFVSDTKPGDRVTIKITKVADGYATANVMSRIMKKESKEDSAQATDVNANEVGGGTQK
jgi:predicted RNA-binding protein with TRAM domain